MFHGKRNALVIGAASGLVIPILAFSCILAAIASYSEFSWIHNALSDLGIISGITGPVFNFGISSSGFLVLAFAVFGLFTYLGNSWVGKIGALTFVATGFALMCIGFFPEYVAPYHYFFSVMFFVLLPISLFISTGAFAINHQTKIALFTVLTAVAVSTPWILHFTFHYVQGVAIPEFVSAIFGSAWVVVLSCKMLTQSQQLKKTEDFCEKR